MIFLSLKVQIIESQEVSFYRANKSLVCYVSQCVVMDNYD